MSLYVSQCSEFTRENNSAHTGKSFPEFKEKTIICFFKCIFYLNRIVIYDNRETSY
jgi:hypothetical protein